MKKLLAMLLSLVMVFTSVSLGVSAAEVEGANYTSLVDKAISAFPEYADRMLTPAHSSTYTRSAADRVLITKETRAISDTESITYAEYSDGLILLSGYDFTYDSTLQNSYPGSALTRIVIDIESACTYGGSTIGTFYLDNVTYVLNNGINNYDYIVSTGTGTRGGGCISATRTTFTQSESSTGYANFTYKLNYQVSSAPGANIQSYLTLYVGEDTAVIDHEGWV